ncbi:deoxycytidyl transferase [Zalaria obscura]|uniref:Deoxycytidyl transferase n=1 Tax=Zalaria obscura TaxID=2024903 RepID=A0ACC3SCJ2_9PEZI
MGSRLESKSTEVRKRIENHTFDNEEGDEYEGSKFGGFTDYFRRKKIKLQNLDAELRAKSGDNPPIFRGIVAHVNGYTQPSLNDLHTLIVSHGGGFLQYLDGKTMVTHIIASNLTPKKAVEFKKYRIVKPAWIVDSVKAGKILPWENYRVLDEGVGQRILKFDNGQVVSQANKQTKSYKEQTDGSWYTSQLKSGQPSQQFRKAPSITQTLTPGEDDIFDDPDFHALVENVEHGLSKAEQEPDILPADLDQSSPGPDAGTAENAASTLGTPPPTSPPEDRSNVSTAASPAASPIASPFQPISRALSTSPTPAAPTSDLPFGRPDHWDSDGEEPRGVKRSYSNRSISPTKAAKMTAEEHNAILLADPRIRKSTVVNPEFLEQYYRESRLHHLSTWKADLKSQLQAMTTEQSSSQRAKQKRKPGSRRYIMHVDFDSFFAAVSVKKFPQYKDKPCVVAHGSGSGSEIASCNYPARKFGISNGMWMKRAQDLCPELKVLPYDFPEYEEASRKFYDAILATGGIVQSVSIDEALVDISAQCIAVGGSDGVRKNEGSQYREQARADEIGQELRDKVLEVTGCNVSVGIGGNILLAKIALRKAKPAGQFQLKPEEILSFIGELEVQKLPGVAYSIGGKLEEIGVKFVKDIRGLTREKIMNTLGPKTGEKLWDYARGIDKTDVGDQVIRKSVSAEVNWGVRFENQEQVDEFIHNLCGELQKRLVKERVKGRQLTMKVMRRSPDAPLDPPKHLGHGKCDTYNKSLQLGVATNDTAIIAKEALATMRGFGFTPGELRGIGVQMTKLEPLKAGADGNVVRSQQRLHFKMGETSKPTSAVPEQTEDPIQDDIQTPKKKRLRDTDTPSVPTHLLPTESPSRKPLNMMGTQFALPTQVDPKVLAELPPDIRAKLIRQRPPPADTAAPPRLSAALPSAIVTASGPSSPLLRPQSKASSRAPSPAIDVHLPTESQLDPETLASLPSDIRAEVLALYQQKSPRKPRANEQALLPQSPRKNRTLPATRGSKRGGKRGGGLFANVARKKGANDSTLTQSNFVARPLSRTGLVGDGNTTGTDTDGEGDAGTLDPEFLAALPEEIRREVLEQQRAERLRRTGGIDLSLHQKKRVRPQQAEQGPIERLFRLPARSKKPTFTTRRLSEIADLRGAVREWVREFTDEEPWREDVEALASYLGLVVSEEKDLDKAVRVARWLSWVVDEDIEQQDGSTASQGKMKEVWKDIVKRVKDAIEEAVKTRGLGPVDFR